MSQRPAQAPTMYWQAIVAHKLVVLGVGTSGSAPEVCALLGGMSPLSLIILSRFKGHFEWYVFFGGGGVGRSVSLLLC